MMTDTRIDVRRFLETDVRVAAPLAHRSAGRASDQRKRGSGAAAGRLAGALVLVAGTLTLGGASGAAAALAGPTAAPTFATACPAEYTAAQKAVARDRAGAVM